MGLRGTEIVFLWNNWRSLRKIYHNNVVIEELGYERKSKKAWITMMHEKLASLLDKYTVNTVSLRYLGEMGVHVGLVRKVHLAILSRTLMQHEIDLLQGRISSITVKHYTKHLRSIAEKYIEAYKPYLTLLEEL